MKIIDDKKVSSGTLFMALNPGDVFEAANDPGPIMMKFYTVDKDPNETAVRLDNGYRCYVRDDLPVHVLDAELVIRR